MVIDLHRKYDNLNILLERAEGQHNEEERFQDMKQSLEIDALCKNVLEKINEPYHTVKVGKNTVKDILKLL